MGGLPRKAGSGLGALALRPYYEVRPEDPEARETLNRLVGFDVAETERRGWDWIERHAPRKSPGPGHGGAVSIPDPADGEPIEITKARALASELNNALLNLKFMYGPERTAERRWKSALRALAEAIEAFLPYAAVREHETSFFASRVSPGGSDRYDEIAARTAKIRAIARGLGTRVGIAQTQIGGYREDPLPGLEQKKPHRNFLARLCARLSLAGFTYAEIGDLVPDEARIAQESIEASYRASATSEEHPEKVRDKLKEHRETYRKEHAERIRSLASGMKGGIENERERSARATAAMDAFLARTGRQPGHAGEWMYEYLNSPEAEAVEDAESAPEDPGE